MDDRGYVRITDRKKDMFIVGGFNAYPAEIENLLLRNQKISQGWSGNWSQSGAAITVTNASWNGSLASGASTQIGANFTYSGTNTAPAAFTPSLTAW